MAAPSFARQTPNFGYPARRVHALLAAIFVIGALLRLVDVLRPVDQPSWREADLSSIARNYYRDGMNILYPRVDWGGSGPGYAEMEFPILPWLMALSYNVLGIQETTGRIISAVSSLLTIWLFIKLGKHLLRDESLLPATAFFAVSPLVVLVSTAIQSESLMLLFYVAAAYSFLRWIDSESSLDLALAAAATAAAILVKGTAAHIGLFFAILAFRHFGVRALWNAKLLLFGFVALLPPVLWYLHARGLWLIYGNSLGVSNETHWAGMALLQHSYIWKGIATI
ncbi:MAG TPA: glycosyltransferase family 39 protein, partial [Bryobacteraceae bacterium]|nr:glycosyltransferase family 39 protein [Bryobacteraceae bacterium]